MELNSPVATVPARMVLTRQSSAGISQYHFKDRSAVSYQDQHESVQPTQTHSIVGAKIVTHAVE